MSDERRFLTVDEIIEDPDYPVKTRATWYRTHAPYVESYLFGGRRFWKPATLHAYFETLRQPPKLPRVKPTPVGRPPKAKRAARKPERRAAP